MIYYTYVAMKSREREPVNRFSEDDIIQAKKIFAGTEYYADEGWLRKLIPQRLSVQFPNCVIHQDLIDESVVSFEVTEEGNEIFEVRLEALNPDTLRVRKYNGIPHQGLASDFYKNILPDFARQCGFRFIIGNNNKSNLSFFIEELGRTHLSEVTEECFYKLGLIEMHPYATVQFLYPEDKAYYT